MKQVLDETQQIHYIDDGDIINFIEQNSNMDWNQCCKFVEKSKIISDGDKIIWVKDYLSPEDLNEDQFYWMTEFFKAHPWINKVMICFDS